MEAYDVTLRVYVQAQKRTDVKAIAERILREKLGDDKFIIDTISLKGIDPTNVECV
jgi:hypothetical protein